MRISGPETAHDCLNLVLEGTLQCDLERAVEQLLALVQGMRRTAEHFAGKCLHLGVKSLWLDQPVEQSHALSLGCLKDVGQQDDLPCHSLSNQVWEYAEAPFTLTSHAYGSIFYLMTGFHGAHVVGGLILMGSVAAAIAGRSKAPTYQTVEVCAYYWHFVDVVWVVMFLTIYVLR